MSAAVLYETHMHTPFCGHAEGEPELYAEAARQRGLAGIVVTCHNPMPDPGFGGPTIRMDAGRLPDYVSRVDEARRKMAGVVDVRLGLECDYFPGFEAYVEQQIAALPLHCVIGSVHPQLEIWKNRFGSADPLQMQRHYFGQLAEAAETGLFDIISHPDLIKNMTSTHWAIDRLEQDICAALDRIAAVGCAMELNTSGRLKLIREMNPAPQILKWMCERKIPVTVGADAHVPQRVGEGFDQALDLLEEIGYDRVNYFLDRQRVPVNIQTARKSLKMPQADGASDAAGYLPRT